MTSLILYLHTLKRVDALAFPNIYLTLRLLGTLPIATCECDRLFSFLSLLEISGHGAEA